MPEPRNRIAALLKAEGKPVPQEEEGDKIAEIRASGIMLTQDQVEKMAGMSDGANIDTAGAMVAMLMRPIQQMDHQLMMALALLMKNYQDGGTLGQKKVCEKEYKAMIDAFNAFGDKYAEWTKALSDGLKGGGGEGKSS